MTKTVMAARIAGFKFCVTTTSVRERCNERGSMEAMSHDVRVVT